MKTLFSVGFQSHDPFTLRHPSFVGSPSLGRALPLRQSPFMGQDNTGSSEFEHVADAAAQANADLRSKLSASIDAGTKKLATVRSWIASRIDADPMLEKTFTKGDSSKHYIVDNFWGYDDMVSKDQYYVDQATQKIASNDPANWDFSDETLGRIDEWNKGIDIMYAAMQEFGGALPAVAVPVKTAVAIINPKTGTPIRSSIAPGATIKTPPPTAGVSTNTLLVGGGIAAAALALILALKA